MRRRALPIVLLLVAALAGCDSNGAEDSDALLLRIENASGVEFSSVYVSFPGVEASYGTVAAGETSAYRELETAYRYGYVEVEAEGQTYRIQPIDFVGEEPLKNGHYTYRLGLSAEDLSLEFKQD